MSTAKSKKAIEDWCKANPDWLMLKHEDDLTPQEEKDIELVQSICADGKNWARQSKDVEKEHIMRFFLIKDSVRDQYTSDMVCDLLTDARAAVYELPDGTFDTEVDTD